jgi:hypothetical protein
MKHVAIVNGWSKQINHLSTLCLEAVDTICLSPEVDGYAIGFTSQPLHKRRSQYLRIGYHSLVMLEDRLDRKTALDLEHSLHEAVHTDKHSQRYRKYSKGELFIWSYG